MGHDDDPRELQRRIDTARQFERGNHSGDHETYRHHTNRSRLSGDQRCDVHFASSFGVAAPGSGPSAASSS